MSRRSEILHEMGLSPVWRLRSIQEEPERKSDDIALMDWIGQKLSVPLYSYFGLDAADAPLTTFSIGIDNPEVTRQKVREANFLILDVIDWIVGHDTPQEILQRKISRCSPPRCRGFADASPGSQGEGAREIRKTCLGFYGR